MNQTDIRFVSIIPFSSNEFKLVYLGEDGLIALKNDAGHVMYFPSENSARIYAQNNALTVLSLKELGFDPISNRQEAENIDSNALSVVEIFPSAYTGRIILKLWDDHSFSGKNIFLGLHKNLCGDKYCNDDNSLVRLTDNERLIDFLRAAHYLQSQQALLDDGTFSLQDYIEWERLCKNELNDLELFDELLFNGAPFNPELIYNRINIQAESSESSDKDRTFGQIIKTLENFYAKARQEAVRAEKLGVKTDYTQYLSALRSFVSKAQTQGYDYFSLEELPRIADILPDSAKDFIDQEIAEWQDTTTYLISHYIKRYKDALKERITS